VGVILSFKEKNMDKKSWKQRLKDGAKIEELVFSEPVQGINSWLERCRNEGLSDREEDYILRCADRFNRISFEVVSPAELAKQFKKTVNL
jgi:hypothetical protein